MVCFRLKRHALNCFIFSDYDSLRDVRKKSKKKPTEQLILIKKIMKLTACMYIRVMISYVRKYSLCDFRKINTNLLYTLTILIICKEEKKLNINIASIFFNLTEINNETHYVAKKIKKTVNLQGSRSSDYAITAMVQ